jgi:PPOX class probable F420-dependent enzyme
MVSVAIPESHRDLLERSIVVTLATITPAGQPHLTAIWRFFDGTHIRFITSRGLQKEKNLQANPLVSVMTLDPQDSGRYLEIRGIVEEITEEGAIEQLDQITQLYTGKPTYYGHIVPLSSKGQRTHVICKIKPIKLVARG